MTLNTVGLQVHYNPPPRRRERDILTEVTAAPRHGARAVRLTTALTVQLGERACNVFDSDVRVRIRSADVSAYPDASVVCGQLETDPDDPDAIVNPSVVIEILSPSTEEYDRGEKLEAYKLLASVQEVVLVAHDEQRIDVVRREGARWITESFRPGQKAKLTSIGCAVDV